MRLQSTVFAAALLSVTAVHAEQTTTLSAETAGHRAQGLPRTCARCSPRWSDASRDSAGHGQAMKLDC
jgi:hypothetical protein